MSKAKTADDKGKKEKKEKTPEEKARGTRETVESIIIAVLLAFLFRAFEAEAFVIPTGSMAPTLQGRHFDVKCTKCGHRYRAGASDDTNSSVLVGSTCPICRYTRPLDPPILGHWGEPDECGMSGDRILVNKFAYELGDPQRWDIIVFKYPGNAKVNYIKRLVGLPGERIRIQYGNIYVKKQDDPGFRIARKPPDKLKAMLHVVDDTDHVPPELAAAGWPSRWENWSEGELSKSSAWKEGENGQGFSTDGAAKSDAWLRYRHRIPHFEDWQAIATGAKLEQGELPQGELITDFYAYNCAQNTYSYDDYSTAISGGKKPTQSGPWPRMLGWHWVGDLAVECVAVVESDSGELLLDLVKGGVHYQCRINVADGNAELSVDGGFEAFQNESGPAKQAPVAATRVKGKGKYRLRFANVDDQLFLWVNESVVQFDGPTTYGALTFHDPTNVKPAWSQEDPGDLAPVGVGSKGAALSVARLRVLRDVYYVAVNARNDSGWDYQRPPLSSQFPEDDPELRRVLTDPTAWSTTRVFDERRRVEFPDNDDPALYLGPTQFFPCGDNSPASKDGRLWTDWNGDPPPYVERNLLIGKALLIYWPHTWNRPVPYITPNFERMRLIR